MTQACSIKKKSRITNVFMLLQVIVNGGHCVYSVHAKVLKYNVPYGLH